MLSVQAYPKFKTPVKRFNMHLLHDISNYKEGFSLHVSKLVKTKTKIDPFLVLQQVLEEVTRCLNLEKLLPCYHHTVTISCLKAIRRLQKNGHLPSDPTLFQTYAQYGHFMEIRLAALEALVDYVKGERFIWEIYGVKD